MKLKLYYFDLRARGEPLQYLLQHSQMDWEDCVVLLEDWASGTFDKTILPSGKSGAVELPVLSITDGTNEATMMMPESHDIAKWIAERCEPSLLGSTPKLQAKSERLFDFYNEKWDIVDPILNYFSMEEAAKHLPKMVDSLEEILSYLTNEIQEDGPYVCGSNLTYADFAIFHLLDNLGTLVGEDNLLEIAAPNDTLRAYYDTMYRLPSVSGRLMERPVAGTGKVGRKGSIIHITKAPSKLDFVQAAWNIKYGRKKGSLLQ